MMCNRRVRTTFSSARTMRAIRKFRILKFEKIVPHIFHQTLGPLQIRKDLCDVRRLVSLGSILPGFIPSFPSQIWVSDITFVTWFGDRQCDASHLSHFWEECDALAHENIFFNLWRLLSHPSRKNVTFWPRWYKTFSTGRYVTIRLGLKHVFLFPSQICHLSRKREAGKPFGLRPTRIIVTMPNKLRGKCFCGQQQQPEQVHASLMNTYH